MHTHVSGSPVSYLRNDCLLLCSLRRPWSSQIANQYLGPCPYRLPTYWSNLRCTYTSFAYAPTLPLTLQSASDISPKSGVTGDIGLLSGSCGIMLIRSLSIYPVPYHFSPIVSTPTSLLLIVFSHAAPSHHTSIIPHRFFICLKAGIFTLSSYHSSVHLSIYLTICFAFLLYSLAIILDTHLTYSAAR
ncbi:hypothetical protein B0H16DRAFT_1562453 [Mycena metata]|uniref:Uncharacterized protein n=1 Tax=Mycena metata TaxID=1033252 RepID=A0AAD7IGU5_9AGAR|nr:hypothetical protein B0H16DRAFT_1562453 [Mycena metata]